MLDFIPKRYVFSMIGLTATTLAIALQTNISLTIVYMVKRTHNLTTLILSNDSFSKDFGNAHLEEISGEFDWSPETQGILVGCQFVGVTLGFLVGGRLAERFGAKFIMLSTLLLASIVTFLMPIVARWSVNALILCRLIVGFGTGPVFPALIHMMSRWIPLSEQNFIASIILAGYGTGAFVSYLTAGVLCASTFLGGWPAAFYVSGLWGLIWCMWCYVAVKESPEEHSSIKSDELEYILKNLGPTRQKIKSVPWKSVLTSIPFWALTIGSFGQYWIQAFFTTSISLYFGGVLHLKSTENGMLSCLPHLIRAVSACIAGLFVDFLARKNVSKGSIRKGVTLVNSFVACFGYVGVIFLSRNMLESVIYLIVGALCSDFCLFGVALAPLDMAPNLAGTISGIITSLANFAFVILPALVGYFTRNNNTVSEWRNVFFCTTGVIIVTTLVYVLFGSSEVQPWAVVDETGRNEEDDSQKDKDKDKTAEKAQEKCVVKKEKGNILETEGNLTDKELKIAV